MDEDGSSIIGESNGMLIQQFETGIMMYWIYLCYSASKSNQRTGIGIVSDIFNSLLLLKLNVITLSCLFFK